MSDVVDRYLACWNETDPAARRALIEQHWSARLRYVDPMADVAGVHALDALVGAVQAQFPGFVFTPAGAVEAHHDVVRFGWGLGPAGAEPVVLGSDVLTLDDDGRIERVVGFLDRVPA